jgi:hypothetical protein
MYRIINAALAGAAERARELAALLDDSEKNETGKERNPKRS